MIEGASRPDSSASIISWMEDEIHQGEVPRVSRIIFCVGATRGEEFAAPT